MELRTFVERTWSDFFALPTEELVAPGVRVTAGAPALAGYRGVYLLRLGQGCTIGVPPELSDEIAERVAGRRADDVFTPDAARALLGSSAGLTLGPSVHAYLDADIFVPQAPCDARRLGPEDMQAFEELREAVPPEQWWEGGFGPDVEELWGIYEKGSLVGAGNMTDFAGRPADVGLAIRPDAHGRGLGTRLAGAMTANTLRTIPVIRYRALETNLPSRAISRRLGFVDLSANIAVRLQT